MRKKIFAFLLLSALYAGAQEVPDWENPIVVGINKEPYHATLTLPSQKADCKEIISLNGKWRFQWSADPGKRPADFYKNDFNIFVCLIYKAVHTTFQISLNLVNWDYNTNFIAFHTYFSFHAHVH